MSNAYIERMRRIQAEFNATRECLIYVTRNWQKKDIQLERALPQDVAQAERNIEATYLIRLYAEFEGILKDHLATNHPRIKIPDKPRVDWLISRVIQAEGVSLEQPLRVRMDDARDYRNSVAHWGEPFLLYRLAQPSLH